jgi:hypothetical protein
VAPRPSSVKQKGIVKEKIHLISQHGWQSAMNRQSAKDRQSAKRLAISQVAISQNQQSARSWKLAATLAISQEK